MAAPRPKSVSARLAAMAAMPPGAGGNDPKRHLRGNIRPDCRGTRPWQGDSGPQAQHQCPDPSQAEVARPFPDEAEKSLRVARVFLAANEVLGGEDEAREWLGEPVMALGGKRPVDLLDTDVGAHEVVNLLNCIKWGVYA